MLKGYKTHSLKNTLQRSYIILLGMMIIPTLYSIIVMQIHTRQYNNIITNVSTANRINQIAKNDIPNNLWDIVCGKKTFEESNNYNDLQAIYYGIYEMQQKTKTVDSKQKLEVALRAYSTLKRNIEMLQTQMNSGSTVTQNETSLDEIRTITALFSDIMQDFILAEIVTANQTNMAIKKSSITLTILQIIIVLLALTISVNGYITVSKSVNEPISDMRQLSTEIAQGNLDARVTIPDVDELQPLANNLNLMAEQINLLIKKNIEEQKNFQKAEMKALQAQITPHFLYNTFDTIIWLAEEEKTEEVVKITKAFSDFLRISLSRGHEWITIQQELDHITNYLTIQKIRYADILSYELSITPELLETPMIKLVLQPLVENAIYHGIKNKRGRGKLIVTVNYTDDTKKNIRFTVSDNGAGFTPERLSEVRAELETKAEDSEKLTSVYGLYNVHKKLKLYYGDKTEGLQIKSEKGKGSEISFVIPATVEEPNV